MRKLLPLFIAIALLAACSDYNRALKSKDTQWKLATAEKFYAKAEAESAPGASRKSRHHAQDDYGRTLPLLEELLSLTRGDTLFERVSYMYAKSNLGIADYILASYYLDNFAKTFPNSAHAEECSFLSAFCHYKESPEFELDQTDTQSAIDQFQVFMARFPQTALKDSCNNLIDGLRYKLEKKDYWNAKLYARTRNYNAANAALKNFLQHWPNSMYREDVLFTAFQCDHDLAVNSVDYRKAERAATGIASYGTFADAFPQSERLSEAQRMRDELQAIIDRAKSQPTP